MYTVQHKPDQTGEIFLDTNKKVISYCGTQFYDFFPHDYFGIKN